MVETIFEKIQNSSEVSASTKKYFKDKFDDRERWSYAFKKELPCLKIKTTSRIESMNSIIKSELNSSKCLVELFFRMLQITAHILNKPYTDINFYNRDLIESLKENVVMTSLKDVLSNHAYSQITHNLSSSFNHEVKLYRGMYTVKINQDYQIQIKKEPQLSCNCTYYKTIGLLCSHILAITVKHKELIPSLEGSIRHRWLNSNDSRKNCDIELVNFCKDFLLKNESISSFFWFLKLKF